MQNDSLKASYKNLQEEFTVNINTDFLRLMVFEWPILECAKSIIQFGIDA